jgi:hypothetical protein
MRKPTDQQVQEMAVQFAAALGGVKYLTGDSLAELVDMKFARMTDEEYREVHAICCVVANEMRAAVATNRPLASR